MGAGDGKGANIPGVTTASRMRRITSQSKGLSPPKATGSGSGSGTTSLLARAGVEVAIDRLASTPFAPAACAGAR